MHIKITVFIYFLNFIILGWTIHEKYYIKLFKLGYKNKNFKFFISNYKNLVCDLDEFCQISNSKSKKKNRYILNECINIIKKIYKIKIKN